MVLKAAKKAGSNALKFAFETAVCKLSFFGLVGKGDMVGAFINLFPESKVLFHHFLGVFRGILRFVRIDGSADVDGILLDRIAGFV